MHVTVDHLANLLKRKVSTLLLRLDEIVKLMFGRDSEDILEFDQDLCKNLSLLVSRTQPSGPLCL